MEMFYRIQEKSRDPQELLDRENWVSRIWTGYAERPCSECEAAGRVRCGCSACDDCFQCDGSGSRSCDTCQGQSYVEDTERRGGVSCCRSQEELFSYFSRRHATLDGCVVVALEGTESDVEDFDVDEGAVLVRPARIANVRDLGPLEVR